MPRPIHFEIHAADPERVQRFYGALFGWSFTPLAGMPYHLIRTGTDGEPGIGGGLVRRMGPNPDPQEPTPVVGYVCTVNLTVPTCRLGRVDGLARATSLA